MACIGRIRVNKQYYLNGIGEVKVRKILHRHVSRRSKDGIWIRFSTSNGEREVIREWFENAINWEKTKADTETVSRHMDAMVHHMAHMLTPSEQRRKEQEACARRILHYTQSRVSVPAPSKKRKRSRGKEYSKKKKKKCPHHDACVKEWPRVGKEYQAELPCKESDDVTFLKTIKRGPRKVHLRLPAKKVPVKLVLNNVPVSVLYKELHDKLEAMTKVVNALK
jgi:hypothetical protein